jgi:hypothetical protein
LENRGSGTMAIGKILTGSLQIFDLTTIDVNKKAILISELYQVAILPIVN